MIQLGDDLAWVRQADGRQTVLRVDRLAAELAEAAAGTGHADWWLAEPIAAAVRRFICDEVAGRTVAAGELRRLVLGALVALGQHDVAVMFAARGRHAEIRLDDLAAQSGGAFELAFFRQLDTALDGAAGMVRMRGLRSCVMQLRGARHWSAGCRRLAEEIVGYVRHRLAQHAAPVRVCLGD